MRRNSEGLWWSPCGEGDMGTKEKTKGFYTGRLLVHNTNPSRRIKLHFFLSRDDPNLFVFRLPHSQRYPHVEEFLMPALVLLSLFLLLLELTVSTKSSGIVSQALGKPPWQ
jgi:hypothetical protein